MERVIIWGNIHTTGVIVPIVNKSKMGKIVTIITAGDFEKTIKFCCSDALRPFILYLF